MHIRMLASHSLHELDEERSGSIAQVPHPDERVPLCGRSTHPLLCQVPGAQDSLSLAEEHLASLRKLHAACVALQEHHTQRVFQRSKMAADHRAANVEVLGCAPEAQRVCKVCEFAQRFDVHIVASCAQVTDSKAPF